jgi:putative hydrolase of HD superfamily
MGAGQAVPDAVDSLVDLLLEAATLKWMPRQGWQMRGVPNPESVAEHSFGVALTALALAGALAAHGEAGPAADLAAVLATAVLHDLGEARVTDLPDSAARLIPGQVKSQAERAAIGQMLSSLPNAGRLQALWEGFERSDTAEGRLVRDADKLEMMVQCLRYEQAGCRGLGEFWEAMDRREWHYPLSARAYARLKELRAGLVG